MQSFYSPFFYNDDSEWWTTPTNAIIGSACGFFHTPISCQIRNSHRKNHAGGAFVSSIDIVFSLTDFDCHLAQFFWFLFCFYDVLINRNKIGKKLGKKKVEKQ